MSRRTWAEKFSDALRGVRRGVRGQSSFFVHFFAAAAVGLAGWALQVSAAEWCLLALCVAGVLAAEMFNTAAERIVKATVKGRNPPAGEALDICSGAVLIAAVGAATVGLIIFVPRLWALFG